MRINPEVAKILDSSAIGLPHAVSLIALLVDSLESMSTSKEIECVDNIRDERYEDVYNNLKQLKTLKSSIVILKNITKFAYILDYDADDSAKGHFTPEVLEQIENERIKQGEKLNATGCRNPRTNNGGDIQDRIPKSVSENPECTCNEGGCESDDLPF